MIQAWLPEGATLTLVALKPLILAVSGRGDRLYLPDSPKAAPNPRVLGAKKAGLSGSLGCSEPTADEVGDQEPTQPGSGVLRAACFGVIFTTKESYLVL